MNRLAAWFGTAFPISDPRAVAEAKRHDAGADRETLKQILLTSKEKTMNAVVLHKPHDDAADRAIAKELAAAEAAAADTGKAFREGMRKVAELQGAEIERLRAVIADMAKERPRKLISVTLLRSERDGRFEESLFGIANDGTHWKTQREGFKMAWYRDADLPQPEAALKD